MNRRLMEWDFSIQQGSSSRAGMGLMEGSISRCLVLFFAAGTVAGPSAAPVYTSKNR